MARHTDSVTSAQARSAKMAAETEEQRKHKEEAEARRIEREKASDKQAREEEEKFIETIGERSSPENREALLDRIREMRAEQPEPVQPPPLTPYMQHKLDEEQAAGRAAVARAKAQQEAGHETRVEAAKEDAAKQGEMSPVHHPNPTQQEVFPTNKATLK